MITFREFLLDESTIEKATAHDAGIKDAAAGNPQDSKPHNEYSKYYDSGYASVKDEHAADKS